MGNDDTMQRIFTVVNQTLDLVKALDQNMKALGQDVKTFGTDLKALRKTVDDFRAQTQDDMVIIKARLRRIETVQIDHEERITHIEQGNK